MKGLIGSHIKQLRIPLLMLLGIGGCIGVAVLSAQSVQEISLSDSPYLRIDPAKIQGAEVCGECHAKEFDSWNQTVHQTQFATLHQSDKAQSILENMGFRLSKRESMCLTCHYTATIRRDQARAVSGVSCESCHGAGRDWMDTHNDYGAADHDTETAAHKIERIRNSVDAGMLRPSGDVYSVAANCFECHTVPNEKLINEGGHPSGSKIELVSWADSIRHNFLAAQWSSDTSNRSQSVERKRIFFLIGAILDYEYSLRGLAMASERSPYSKAMERRVKVAFRELRKISDVLSLQDLVDIVRIGGEARLVPGNGPALTASADEISSHAKAISGAVDGLDLSSLEGLMSGDAVAQPAADNEGGALLDSEPEADAPSGAAAAPVTTETADADSPGAAAATTNRATAVGQRRSRPSWFPTESFETTVPGCSCHTPAEEWLLDDPHSGSLDIISSPRAKQIARIYGLSSDQMLRGDQMCMSCHGTVVSGDEREEVFDAVSCESCHGPSSGYLDPHERGNGAGYNLGMRNLKNATLRVSTCATCHHITDERLLSAGHPTGEDYDIAVASANIEHWPDDENIKRSGPYPSLSSGALTSAFSLLRSTRTIPSVTVVQETPVSTEPARASNSAIRADPGATIGTFSLPGTPRIRQDQVTGTIDAPLPIDTGDATSTEDLLLAVKHRLEAIYRALGRSN